MRGSGDRGRMHPLDECFDNIIADRPELSAQALARTRQLMNEAVRDCLVSGYESLTRSRTG
jgi:hypothetical protein